MPTSESKRIFTRDWHNQPEKRLKHLGHLAGIPIKVLEIGVHEGRSTCWMFDHIAKHPESIIVAVDPFGYAGGDSESENEAHRFRTGAEVWGQRPVVRKNFFHNTDVFGDRIRHWEMTSDKFFSQNAYQPGHFEVVIIDGGHSATQAAKDLLHSWSLLAVGGVLVFDDYEWKGDRDWKCNGPKRAMDAFLTLIPPSDVEVVYKGYIVILKKVG
jgi:hypothetical protein